MQPACTTHGELWAGSGAQRGFNRGVPTDPWPGGLRGEQGIRAVLLAGAGCRARRDGRDGHGPVPRSGRDGFRRGRRFAPVGRGGRDAQDHVGTVRAGSRAGGRCARRRATRRHSGRGKPTERLGCIGDPAPGTPAGPAAATSGAAHAAAMIPHGEVGRGPLASISSRVGGASRRPVSLPLRRG